MTQKYIMSDRHWLCYAQKSYGTKLLMGTSKSQEAQLVKAYREEQTGRKVFNIFLIFVVSASFVLSVSGTCYSMIVAVRIYSYEVRQN